jgi:hypothetical protein
MKFSKNLYLLPNFKNDMLIFYSNRQKHNEYNLLKSNFKKHLCGKVNHLLLGSNF